MRTTNTIVEAARIGVEVAEEQLFESECAQRRLAARITRFVGMGLPGDPAERELWRQELQQLHGRAAELQSAAEQARAELQHAKGRLEAALRDRPQAEHQVAGPTIPADEHERQRPRRLSDHDPLPGATAPWPL